VTIPADVTRVSIIGTGPGSEVFDTSFWLVGDAPLNSAGANAIAASVVTAWNANAANAWKTCLATTQQFTEVRVYGYKNGGPTAQAIGTAAITGGTGTGANKNALQVCMVVSLRTLFAGRRNRGRMYLPATGLTPSSAHDFSSTNVTNVATGTAAFFTALNALPAAYIVGVVSQVGAGATNGVTSVYVDGKPDIQRRRANKFVSPVNASATVTI
jgi:hypothetical protein